MRRLFDTPLYMAVWMVRWIDQDSAQRDEMHTEPVARQVLAQRHAQGYACCLVNPMGEIAEEYPAATADELTQSRGPLPPALCCPKCGQSSFAVQGFVLTTRNVHCAPGGEITRNEEIDPDWGSHVVLASPTGLPMLECQCGHVWTDDRFKLEDDEEMVTSPWAENGTYIPGVFYEMVEMLRTLAGITLAALTTSDLSQRRKCSRLRLDAAKDAANLLKELGLD